MALGFLNIPWKSVVLAYDDIKTPVGLTGKKMLPILTLENGSHINESLNIIEHLDSSGKLSLDRYKEHPTFDSMLSRLGDSVHPLCMPYWIYTKEFSPNAREYFAQKKKAKYASPASLISRREELLLPLEKELAEIEKNLTPFYAGPSLSILDILLASHLWGMYLVVEFQFSPILHDYLQRVKGLCHFDYHQDFWR